MSSKKNNTYKSFLLGIMGALLLVVGISFVLLFWEDVVSLFKGMSGIVFAISGLTILYFLGK